MTEAVLPNFDPPSTESSVPAVPPASHAVEFDLHALEPAALNASLRGLAESVAEVRIARAAGQAGLATGLIRSIKVQVEGNVGVYFAMLNSGANFEVVGDAAAGCGHSMTSGAILVRGHAGHSLAAFARGGFIGVHGSAKHACALGLSGADVVVRQSVGPRAAEGMRAGNLVLGSDAGENLGEGCTGGTIYLRGHAASIADALHEVRMRESDAMRLGLLLVRAGIKSATKEFRVYRPRAQAALQHA